MEYSNLSSTWDQAASDYETSLEPPATSKHMREPSPPRSHSPKRRKLHHDGREAGFEDDFGYSTSHRNGLTYEDYTVAWICALHLEMAAARAMLDQIHETLPTDWTDSNSYVMGSIQQHNVVIACLPTNQYGIVNAATVAANLQRTFKSIKIALMVGIGGGAPGAADLRLGDVVVGTRVMQSDLGKFVGDDFQRTAYARLPPLRLSTLVSNLRAKHELDPSRLSEIVSEKLGQFPEYTRPSSVDCIFKANYEHISPTPDCDRCEQAQQIKRSIRKTERPVIHYGAIASASHLMRDAVHRDRIARELGVICFEMEAAGIVDTLPCLVVRGISDYSDSHKDKYWQRYAAAAAAAYARELLEECRVAHGSARVAPARDTQASIRQRFLKVLMFDKIKAREKNIKDAHAKTCRWFLEHPEYKAWLDETQLSQHHGFLWIRGKPGAGKSTLMKFAFSEFKSAAGNRSVTTSFFFNARGEYLERSVVGMYRSLLYHLLQKFRSLPVELDHTEQSGLDQGECPPLETLKEMFRAAVLSLGDRSLTCFIDALDESDEQQIVEMVQFFEELAESSTQEGIKFRVCFSSRHYPYIDIRKGKRLILEDLPQHREDMENYVQSRLRINDRVLEERMRSKILEKAAGVFLWIALVVDILNKEYRNGAMALEKRFADLPSDLSTLFKNILQRDQANMSQRDRDELLFSVLWILYAKRPLSPQEYEHALWSGLHPKGVVDSVVPDSSARDQNGSTKRYIISSSKGLAELTRSETPTVQFIHESVRDFLIKDHGLATLWPNHDVVLLNQESLGHEELKICCRAYLDHYWSQDSKGLELFPKDPTQAQSRRNEYSFLTYAAQNILHHANISATTITQVDFLTEFPLVDWIRTVKFVEWDPGLHYTRKANLAYILADRGCAELIRTMPLSDDACPGVRSKERFRYPLFAALANGDITTALTLLGLATKFWDGADISRELLIKGKVFKLNRKKFTPLSWASNEGLAELVRLLIHRGASIEEADEAGYTPLLRGAGHDAVVKVLLEAGANIKATTKDGGMAIHEAARGRGGAAIRRLINAGAEVNARDSQDRTPLHYAFTNGEGTVDAVKTLIQEGANIHALDRFYATPLHRASRDSADVGILGLLLQAGADINAQTSDGITPLHLVSSQEGGQAAASFLVNRGANIEVRCIRSRTPLHAIANDSFHFETSTVCRFLIEKGATIDARDEDGCTPLLLACAKGYRQEQLVETLVEAGAEVNARDRDGLSPLHRATSTEIARVLIQGGAEVNACDNRGQTPLHKLDDSPYVEDRTRLLVQNGADVHARDNEGRTPLHEVSVHSAKRFPVYSHIGLATAKLLVRERADVNARDNEGRTPLGLHPSLAIQKLLLESGADLEIRDNFGRTPLLNFVWKINGGHPLAELQPQIEDLVKWGADVYAIDNDGESPLKLARQLSENSPDGKVIKKQFEEQARILFETEHG